MADPIEGRVAEIVSLREVAINRGSDHGVAEDMVFAILADTPLQITDPDTGNMLGAIDREKVRVQAAEVYDKMSICRTYETFSTGAWLDALSAMVPRTRIRTLKVGDSDLPPPLPEDQSFVKVGDRVRQVTQDEIEEAE